MYCSPSNVTLHASFAVNPVPSARPFIQLVDGELCPCRRRKRAAFELVDSQRLRFEDHGLRDNVALLTLLQPRRQQEAPAPAGQLQQQRLSANGGAVAANGAAANGAPAGQRSGGCGAAPAAVAAAAARSGGGPPLLFGNTHILFNPKRGDIKVRSTTLISRRLPAFGICKQQRWVHGSPAHDSRGPCRLCRSVSRQPWSCDARRLHRQAARQCCFPHSATSPAAADTDLPATRAGMKADIPALLLVTTCWSG